jgi:predicted TPR repeat methyltransferase
VRNVWISIAQGATVTSVPNQPRITSQQAEQIFEIAVRESARDPLALYEIGLSAHQVGRDDLAADLFAKAIALDAGVADVWVGMGVALRALNKLPEAAEAYRRALSVQPDHAEAHNNLGNALLADGDRDGALACYRDALRHRKDYPEAHYNAGNLLHQMGRSDEAARHLRAYLEQDPADSLGGGLLLARIGFGETPARASPAQMEKLYRARSEIWDEDESYRVHEHVARRLENLAHGSGLNILDAGCGTGLVGERVARLSRRLDGVDLSPEMLEKARQKGVYTELHQEDLVAFLNSSGRRYDAIVSAATLIHFGDLRAPLEAAACALEDGGWFIFTLLFEDETVGAKGFAPASSINLARGGCYAHDPAYVAAVAKTAGFSVLLMTSEIQEYEQVESGRRAISALVVTLRRDPRPRGTGNVSPSSS